MSRAGGPTMLDNATLQDASASTRKGATSDSSSTSGSTIHPSRRACCRRCASSGVLVLETAPPGL
jgi:hypothetical protein